MRIVSLIASATEIVWGLGYGDKLVARSHECDNPHDVTKLPAITTPKFTIDGNSLDIDRKVHARCAGPLVLRSERLEELRDLVRLSIELDLQVFVLHSEQIDLVVAFDNHCPVPLDF